MTRVWFVTLSTVIATAAQMLKRKITFFATDIQSGYVLLRAFLRSIFKDVICLKKRLSENPLNPYEEASFSACMFCFVLFSFKYWPADSGEKCLNLLASKLWNDLYSCLLTVGIPKVEWVRPEQRKVVSHGAWGGLDHSGIWLSFQKVLAFITAPCIVFQQVGVICLLTYFSVFSNFFFFSLFRLGFNQLRT